MKRVEHLNHSRQALKAMTKRLLSLGLDPSFAEREENYDSLDEALVTTLSFVMRELPKTQKFQLPPNGLLDNDRDLKAIDETMELNLPFSNMAIEYEAHIEYKGEEGKTVVEKRIIIAQQHEKLITITPIFFDTKLRVWLAYPTVGVSRNNYMKRHPENAKVGKPTMSLGIKIFPFATDYHDEYNTAFITVLSLLNVLQCSNVVVTKTKGKKLTKKQKRKNALPFDSYHALTIVGSGTGANVTNSTGQKGSSREKRTHLRRGHIRRLQSGKTVWVTACIINPDKDNFVGKTYNIKG